MAGRAVVACVGPSYQLPDRRTADQRAINLAVQQVEGLSETPQAVLVSADGLAQLIDFGAPVRGGLVTADQREFVVAGNTLYETTTGVQVSRGALSTSSGAVCLCAGETQLVVVDGEFGYILTFASNVLAQITDADFRASIWVTVVDGTFVFVPVNNQEQFFLSAIDDASTINALDFSSADAVPGAIVTSRVLKQETYFFKPYTTEVWIYDGDLDFPMVRYNSTPISVGCVGLRAAVIAADTLVFVGRTERGTGIVYQMIGHQPIRISTQAVEEALQADGVDLAGCVLWVQQKKNAEYVGISAPGMSTTWVWDAVTKLWHERGEMVNGAWTTLRVEQVLAFGNQHHALAGTALYRMAGDVYTIGSDPLVRERTWPHFANPSAEPVNFRGLELNCSTGHGGNITLECSNDGGVTWGSPKQRPLGATGRWMERVRWLFLGSSPDRVFRLRCSDAVPLTIRAAAVDAS